MLSNMGQHRQALMIYVFKMQDYAKAEEYEPPLLPFPIIHRL